jgi:hypothetical protein
MKKLMFGLPSFFLFLSLPAQQCLNISISTLMNQMTPPADAAGSFKKCSTAKNDRNQTIITDYGADNIQLDTTINRTMREFTLASVSSTTATRPNFSSQDAATAKELSETLKSMTPEQQKEWAMQVAQDKMKNPGSAGNLPQDDAQTTKTIYETREIAIIQMKGLNDQMAQKMRDIHDESEKEIKALAKDDKSKCPSNVVGMPLCDCSNQIESKYWKQAILVEDKYNSRKIALFQEYFPKMKAMAATVDNIVMKYNRGDALKSPSLKSMLFSTQSAAFANAFLMLSQCEEDVRKSGSDAFVNRLNSDNKVYAVDCASK